ncbi:hypothetical protein Mapa_014188 [Marchantia paleacea]|nr:hypothetical protein Mapa_014188 [Marchantia paleacea]
MTCLAALQRGGQFRMPVASHLLFRKTANCSQSRFLLIESNSLPPTGGEWRLIYSRRCNVHYFIYSKNVRCGEPECIVQIMGGEPK